MKKLFLLCIMVVLLAIPVYAIDVPDQCKGKEIFCTMGVGTCTLMHCEPVYKYDKDGKYIGTTECPNQCTYYKHCWCEGHQWDEPDKDFPLSIYQDDLIPKNW